MTLTTTVEGIVSALGALAEGGRRPPLKCDVCGRFVPLADLVSGVATRRLLTPDSHFTREEYETLCADHAAIAALDAYEGRT